MKQVEPQIFLLARPAINEEGLTAYLQAVGASGWDTDAPSGAEKLIEIAGRSCYRSFEPGLNPNVTKVREGSKAYLENILSVKHGSVLEHASWSFAFFNVSRVFCYDADTEVLTSEGWKPWPKVDGTELFATLNPDTDRLEYQRAEEHFGSKYDGPMYRICSEQVDLLVTPQHRMWVRKFDTQAAKRGEQPYRIELASGIMGKRVQYQKTARWEGQDGGVIRVPGTYRTYQRHDRDRTATRYYPGAEFPAEPFARFLGHWLAEGSINGHQIVLAQNRGPALEAMAENIRAMGLPAYIPATGPGNVRTQHTALRDFLVSCSVGAHYKRVPGLVHSWGPKLIRILLEALVEGDGSKRKDAHHWVIYTTSPDMADDIQVLAIKAGWSANIRLDDRTGLERRMKSGQVFKNLRPCYIVSLVKRRTHPLVNHGGKRHDRIVYYSGTIHCVKVPNGLLFVRRNGKPVVSGNTHELVRHRAGTAISQESLRFVRLTEIGMWLPPDIRENPEALALFEEAVRKSEEAQQRMADVLAIEGRPFHEKKVLTSAMRRVAPDGLATTIIWSANARTLRWVIEARTEPGAEVEIRLVFGKVAEIMKKEAPHLFGDFKEIPLPDGTFQWQPEHSKV